MTWIQPNAENNSYKSDNDFLLCRYVNWEAIWSRVRITNIFAAFIAERESDTVIAPIPNGASTECQ